MEVTAPFEPALCVRDFDACVAFYRDVLEMSVFSIDEIPAELSARAKLAPDGYRIARLETRRGDRLKIVSPRTAPSPTPAADFVMARAGFGYLTFIVPDLGRVMAALDRAGARIVTGPAPVSFRPGIVDLFFAQDPEGNFLEFVQRSDLATYRPAAAGH